MCIIDPLSTSIEIMRAKLSVLLNYTSYTSMDSLIVVLRFICRALNLLERSLLLLSREVTL